MTESSTLDLRLCRDLRLFAIAQEAAISECESDEDDGFASANEECTAGIEWPLHGI